MGLFVGIEYRTSGTGEGTTRETEVLAHCLSDDSSSSVQDPCSNCGVHVRNEALEHGGTVHHGNSRQTYVVFEGDLLISELAGTRPFNVALPILRIEGVF